MRTKKVKKTVKMRCIFFLLLSLILINGLNARETSSQETRTGFPNGHFWSLDAGFGMSDILVDGSSFQIVIDPKLWLSPLLMIGSKAGINYSTDDILTLEGQVYLRFNLLRLGRKNKVNIFLQGGLGLLSAYRGWDNVFDDVTRTRGSVLADAAAGITIPLGQRFHIEPMVRGGYPHIWGVSLTAGYKFRLHQSAARTEYRTEYIEVIKTIPPGEIVKMIKISSIEFILFGPDIGRYNIGIDRDAQQLNELVLNQVSRVLNEDPNLRVRVEGHANPYTINISEAEDLMALSSLRANTVAEELKKRNVKEEQIVIVGFGGTRTATNEWDIRNRNRRVELMIIQLDIE